MELNCYFKTNIYIVIFLILIYILDFSVICNEISFVNNLTNKNSTLVSLLVIRNGSEYYNENENDNDNENERKNKNQNYNESNIKNDKWIGNQYNDINQNSNELEFSNSLYKNRFLQISSSYIANMCINISPICGSSPVCAYKFCNNDKELCFESKNNNCKACQEYNAEYYVNDVCERIGNKTVFIKCNNLGIDNNNKDKCDDVIYRKTVCGKFKTSANCENEKCRIDFKNSCLACMDNRIDSFYYGECFTTISKLWFVLIIILSILVLC